MKSRHNQKVMANFISTLFDAIKNTLRTKGFCVLDENNKPVLMNEKQLEQLCSMVLEAISNLVDNKSRDVISYITEGYSKLIWGTTDFSVIIESQTKKKIKSLALVLRFNKWCTIKTNYEEYDKALSNSSDKARLFIQKMLKKANEKAASEGKDIIINLNNTENIARTDIKNYPFGMTDLQLTEKVALAMGFIQGAKNNCRRSFLLENLDALDLQNEEQLNWVLYQLEVAHRFLTPADEFGERELRSVKQAQEKERELQEIETLSKYPFGYTTNELIRYVNEYARHIVLRGTCLLKDQEILHAKNSSVRSRDLVKFMNNQLVLRNIIGHPDFTGNYIVNISLFPQLARIKPEIEGKKVVIYDFDGSVYFVAVDFTNDDEITPIGAIWKKTTEGVTNLEIIFKDNENNMWHMNIVQDIEKLIQKAIFSCHQLVTDNSIDTKKLFMASLESCLENHQF